MCEFSTVNTARGHRLHTALPKDSAISFTVRLVENKQSNPLNGITGSEVPVDGTAKMFDKERYPKLQSFKSAHHSKRKEKILLVGGRYVHILAWVHIYACKYVIQCSRGSIMMRAGY